MQVKLQMALQLLTTTKINKQTTTDMESGEGGWGAVWTVTSPMYECMGVSVKKMFLSGILFVEKLQRKWGYTCVSAYACKCLHYDSAK